LPSRKETSIDAEPNPTQEQRRSASARTFAATDVKRNAIVIALVIVAVTLMLWSGRFLARKAGPGFAPQAGLRGEVKGAVAPDFELQTLDGKSVRLSDFRGQAVLLNFWATWCGPCKIEMPWLVEFQKQYGPRGLRILGIAMDDAGQKAIADFAREMGVNYTILQGKESMADLYGGLAGLPSSFYVDRAGKIVDHHVGLVSRSDIEEKIKAALGTSKPEAAAAAKEK